LLSEWREIAPAICTLSSVDVFAAFFQADGVFQTLGCCQSKRMRVSQATFLVRFARKSEQFLSLKP